MTYRCAAAAAGLELIRASSAYCAVLASRNKLRPEAFLLNGNCHSCTKYCGDSSCMARATAARWFGLGGLVLITWPIQLSTYVPVGGELTT